MRLCVFRGMTSKRKFNELGLSKSVAFRATCDAFSSYFHFLHFFYLVVDVLYGRALVLVHLLLMYFCQWSFVKDSPFFCAFYMWEKNPLVFSYCLSLYSQDHVSVSVSFTLLLIITIGWNTRQFCWSFHVHCVFCIFLHSLSIFSTSSSSLAFALLLLHEMKWRCEHSAFKFFLWLCHFNSCLTIRHIILLQKWD